MHNVAYRRYENKAQSENLATKQLATRAAVFAILGPLGITCVHAGSPALDLLAGVGCGLGAFEAASLVQAAGTPISVPRTVICSLLVLRGSGSAALALAATDLFGLTRMSGRERSPASKSAPLAVAVVVGGPLNLGLRTRKGPRGKEWLAWGMATTWLADAGAYLLGPRMDGPHLPASINERKTWFGYIPGTVLGSLSGCCAARGLRLRRRNAALLGATLGLSAAVGDAVESALKRKARRVDSANLLPGYGGLLDRLDSLLASTVLLYAAQRLAQRNAGG